MEPGGLFERMENGMVILPGQERPAGDLPWRPHPAFRGVTLKHLVTSKATGGLLSAHLVRIEPGREIGEHRHEGKMELHEVVQGEGLCLALGKELTYKPGVVALMPPDEPHRISAGEQGLCLLVKFAPALF